MILVLKSNISNALMLLNQQQVTLNIENNKAETGLVTT